MTTTTPNDPLLDDDEGGEIEFFLAFIVVALAALIVWIAAP